MVVQSEIVQFYTGQTVLITGGSGYLGKLLLEKILRVCFTVNKIYLILRPKHNKTIEERLDAILDNPCFKLLEKSRDEYKKKIVLIQGDLMQPNLGLNDDDRLELIREVTCVFNAAANTKFDQHLADAALINVRAVRDMLKLAKEMHKLKVYIHISTAYSHCPRSEIAEVLYEPPMPIDDFLQLIDTIDRNTIDTMTSQILSQWPNTYVFTKAIGETVVGLEGANLPLAIVRPSIVVNTVEEPIKGYYESLFGAAGVFLGLVLGVIRSLHYKSHVVLHMVPGDFVVNNLLAVGWSINKEGSRRDQVKIYNYVGSEEKKIKNCYLKKYLNSIRWDIPSIKTVWYPVSDGYENETLDKINKFFFHTINSYLLDFVLICLRRKPMAVRSVKKIHRLLDMTSYFFIKLFHFEHRNVEELWMKLNEVDRKLFNFDVNSLDAKKVRNALLGFREIMLSDPPETLPMARRRMLWLAALHYGLQLLGLYLLYRIILFLW